MFPLIPAIAAGAGLLGNVLNNNAQSKANQQSQEWQEKMYGIQRADALADWNRQNEYNSPEAQMKRLTSAGLNPNLVYGSGSAVQPSQAIRSSSPGSYQAKPMQYDLQTLMPTIFSLLLTQAQTENAKVQATLNKQKTGFEVAKWNFFEDTRNLKIAGLGYDNANKLQQNRVMTQQEEKLKTDIGYTIASKVRQDLLAGNTIQETLQRIKESISRMSLLEGQKAELTQRINNMLTDNELKKLELRRQGVWLGEGDASDTISTITKYFLDKLKF